MRLGGRESDVALFVTQDQFPAAVSVEVHVLRALVVGDGCDLMPQPACLRGESIDLIYRSAPGNTELGRVAAPGPGIPLRLVAGRLSIPGAFRGDAARRVHRGRRSERVRSESVQQDGVGKVSGLNPGIQNTEHYLLR